ncbi:MAG: SDR family oxidoreductase [Dehalococcoidales bacterium]|nr:SDR family oxidoreductase [Dehalococcoidales bacterium]
MSVHSTEHSLEGRTALVTGGRRGIGKAIGIALARAGADIALCDIVAEDGRLEAAAEEIRQMGRRSLGIQADISLEAGVETMISGTVDCFHNIDILVNCAGIWLPGQTLIECGLENWDRVIDTNLRGTFLCCRAAGSLMAERKQGNIINVASQVGLTAGKGIGAYSISKAAIIMLTRQLALELAGYNIRVNALAPGVVKTDFNAGFWKDPQVEKRSAGMVPLGRLAEPEDIADCAVFLASDASRYVTGEVLAVNGGWQPGG